MGNNDGTNKAHSRNTKQRLVCRTDPHCPANLKTTKQMTECRNSSWYACFDMTTQIKRTSCFFSSPAGIRESNWHSIFRLSYGVRRTTSIEQSSQFSGWGCLILLRLVTNMLDRSSHSYSNSCGTGYWSTVTTLSKAQQRLSPCGYI